jgi:hypothetical protein
VNISLALILLIIISTIFMFLDQRILAQNQNSSGSVLDPGSIIQSIAGIATAAGLVYAALTFKQSRQDNQITMSTALFKDFVAFN